MAIEIDKVDIGMCCEAGSHFPIISIVFCLHLVKRCPETVGTVMLIKYSTTALAFNLKTNKLAFFSSTAVARVHHESFQCQQQGGAALAVAGNTRTTSCSIGCIRLRLRPKLHSTYNLYSYKLNTYFLFAI